MTDTPADLLEVADRIRRQARRKRRGAWFVLVAFGLLALLSAPLYLSRQLWAHPDGSSMWISGGWWTAVYWVAGIPLTYLACVRFFRVHADRTGVAQPVWPWVATGLGLFVLVVLLSPFPSSQGLGAFQLGWTVPPFVAMVAGLLALSWTERNPTLAVLSIALLVLAASSQWIYNQFISWPRFSGIGFSMVMAGLALVAAGIVAKGREDNGT